MSSVSINLMEGDVYVARESIRARVVLTVDDIHRDIQKVTLDSAPARSKVAKLWGTRFDLEPVEIEKRLAELSVKATGMAKRQAKTHLENQAKASAEIESAPKLLAQMEDFIRGLRPVHHRQGKAIYLETLGREVLTTNLWLHLADSDLVQVNSTAEALAARGRRPDLDFNRRAAMVRNACAMAATRVIQTIPELENADRDPTVNPETLRSKVAAYLLKTRSLRPSNGNPITISFWSWACGLRLSGHWLQCLEESFFGRIDEAGGLPRMAAPAAVLVEPLGYASPRRLKADLEGVGLIQSETTIKVAGKARRVLVFSDQVAKTISEDESSEETQIAQPETR